MDIIALNEGIYAVNKQKQFTKITQENAGQIDAKSLKMAVCPFLVITNNDVILLDAGLGFWQDNQPQIIYLIKQAGYDAHQITKVLLSHLHKDHLEGIGYFEGDVFIQNFPDATIYLQKEELEYALTQPDNPSFNQAILAQLALLPNLHFLDSHKGLIDNYILYEVTGGHSPYHQVFWIQEASDEASDIVFYGSDDLPQENYLKFHLAYKSDFDGKKAKELRQHWEEQAKEKHWSVLLYHDIENNILKF
ncbi:MULTISPECIES: MBL fold metallo-hydrolase [unclassified Arcicella]|uniref:MBL fold metallo-hydrolase n=1 Tax=unclassified Arcicella TaxID=2644986 RepID=UPI0028621BB6|nr:MULTISPECIES: MBL fold metallo-hydrolase [unclassified Arcicella]MDR6564350.1 glyoxylase-like metal-dependent hydrolase (beta-lactamase superfamily II) [Arcicella sp. BE51]MDR6814100.1 glyoxylase-like metal-dependent hydrolase (beta-lactamase superfamily II) [Arcicella sp. BE140]MDR6825412.1 glyoxylase-like metal-dependent hydrolase (beta-lactamase superfamily II) [Arcicella sp. BE139]